MRINRNHILIFLIASLGFSGVWGNTVVADFTGEEPIMCLDGENLEEVEEGKEGRGFDLDPDAAAAPVLCSFSLRFGPAISVAGLRTSSFSKLRLYLLFSQLTLYW